jgi:putative ABC transport system substrate-binding protein
LLRNFVLRWPELKNQFGMVLRLSAEAMKRREFITLLSSAATWPLVARAQPTPRRPIVAFVHAVIAPAEMAGSDPVSPLARAFVHGLRDLGWVEGRTIVIDRRPAEGQPQRAPAIFAELVTRGVDVIATPIPSPKA